MQKKLLFFVLMLGATKAAPNTQPPPTEFIKNKHASALLFPFFAASAYYFFDEASNSFDEAKNAIRSVWNASMQKRSGSWLAKTAESISKKIVRRRTRQELWYKELDKQTYYLVGAIGMSIITWALRTHFPQAKKVLYIGEKG